MFLDERPIQRVELVAYDGLRKQLEPVFIHGNLACDLLLNQPQVHARVFQELVASRSFRQHVSF
jgi:hypothetical protein